jgi:hypothetical protein
VERARAAECARQGKERRGKYPHGLSSALDRIALAVLHAANETAE